MAGPDFNATKPVNSSALVAAEMRTNFTAVARRLTTITALVGNVGAGEDDLMSYALAAGLLATDGQAIRVTAVGIKANNANAKTLRFRFGGTILAAVALGTSAAAVWRMVVEIVRTGATTQYGATITVDNAVMLAGNGYPAEALSGSITLKCTGDATSNNDIQQTLMVVELLP